MDERECLQCLYVRTIFDLRCYNHYNSLCVCYTHNTYVPVKHTSVVLPGRSTGGSSLSERKWCDSCGLLASGFTAVMATGCLKWLLAERVTLNSLYYGREGRGSSVETGESGSDTGGCNGGV